jgi:hypothetical protein
MRISNGEAALSQHVAAQLQAIVDPINATPKEFPDGLGINGNIVRSRTNLSFAITANSNGVSVYPVPAQLIVRSGATYDMSAGTTTTTDALYVDAINVASVETVRCLGLMVKLTSQTSQSSAYPKVNVWMGRRLVHTARTAIKVGLPDAETRGRVLAPDASSTMCFLWIPQREHDFCTFAKAATYTGSNDSDGSALLERPAIHFDVVYAGSTTTLDLEVHALWSLQLAQTAVYRADDVQSPNSTLAKDATLNLCASLVKEGAWYQDQDNRQSIKQLLDGIFRSLLRTGSRLAYRLAEGAWVDWMTVGI